MVSGRLNTPYRECFAGVKTPRAAIQDKKRMSAEANTQPKMAEMFQTKYEEFATDLSATFPELEAAIKAALAIPAAERMAAYKTTVFAAART